MRPGSRSWRAFPRSTSCAASSSACCKPRRRGSRRFFRHRRGSLPVFSWLIRKVPRGRLNPPSDTIIQNSGAQDAGFGKAGGRSFDLDRDRGGRAVQNVGRKMGRLRCGTGRGGGTRRRSCGSGGRSGGRKNRIRRDPRRNRREEDQRDQGGARDHQSRPQGGQGSRRGGTQADQGRGQQGRGGKNQKTT